MNKISYCLCALMIVFWMPFVGYSSPMSQGGESHSGHQASFTPIQSVPYYHATQDTDSKPTGPEKYKCHQNDGIGKIVCNISSLLVKLMPFIQILSIVTGLGFFVASLFKFKAHKDNPSQVPVGTPIAYMMVSIALMYASGVVKIIGTSFFPNSKDNVTVIGDGQAPDDQLPDTPK